jgi:hypothetical protein
VSYGSNLQRKDNPYWLISNATETLKVPVVPFWTRSSAGSPWGHPVAGLSGFAVGATHWAGRACAICTAWLIGLPRRAGTRLHVASDTEATWWHWQVTESCAGLVRQYRDARFAALPIDPAVRRTGLSNDAVSPDTGAPGCSSPGDR